MGQNETPPEEAAPGPTPTQVHISEEIRRRRRELGLSLEAVPSTVVLSRLAEALGVTAARLMVPATEQEVLLIKAARQPVLRDESSGLTRRILSPVLPGRGIDWVRNTLPPGARTGEFVAHRRGVSEYVHVLGGRLRVTIGERTVEMEAGDSLYFEADAGHAFANPAAEPCDYLLVIDPSRAR
ncbi:Cupin 2 conserved barrel domain protein [Methylobacterium sp. 4-46]|uniref:cupin domain-containing protein n=1 Tax=unclassified Methylobacterium TaxID=2615210 RepID=UPI000152DD0D|nr:MULTISPECIES: cupin domain-containing protein [Methylobacterium]ACA19159.1 Cupin 2 conserved barrel domain protein [Methylobacterium sp. 4-46]WFT78367.1 cupin domain-containing protein [Methylobacterium nodulans]